MDDLPVPTFTDARRVMDFTVGFRYRARLFRPPMAAVIASPIPPYRFALVVLGGPADAPESTPPVVCVTARDSSLGGPAVLGLHVADRYETHGSFDDITNIDGFVARAADLVCEHLGVDRGTFRPVPGSEAPAPWETVPADARLCVVCGAPIAGDDDCCAYCGGPARP